MMLLPGAALLSAAWALKARQKKQFLPILWLVSLMLMFNFMSSSFASYKPLVLDGFERYMYPLLLPSLILVGGFIAGLLVSVTDKSKFQKERLVATVIIAICFLGFSARTGRKVFMSRPEQVERRVAARLTNDDIVYSDYRSAATLVFFRSGTILPANSKTLPWENIKQEQIPNGAYVLVDKAKVNLLAKMYGYKTPGFVTQPPPSWETIWNNAEDELYLVRSR
jgi:hypothetical protein